MNKLVLIFLITVVLGCQPTKKTQIQSTSDIAATAPFIIYKTRADYSNLVPVMMDSSKTIIVAYPAPSDLGNESGLLLPLGLTDGYLLDNKGIGLNVAFTSYTYKEYILFEQAPDLGLLTQKIIDRDPLLEIYDCRNCSSIRGNLIKINRLIQNGFKDCIQLK